MIEQAPDGSWLWVRSLTSRDQLINSPGEIHCPRFQVVGKKDQATGLKVYFQSTDRDECERELRRLVMKR